ncbi:MAG: methionine--tRNA ligase [Rickettsiales bacterium]
MTKSFYITTPIYYVNDRPHIGHAYTTIACDVLARFKRLDGYHVKFLTGTDEHGQKVEKSAKEKGVAPKAFVDDVSQHFRELTGLLNISNDDFIRTTEPRHIKSAQGIWKKLEESGDIYLGSYSGWYSVRDEAYYAESELIEGKAPTGAPVEWVEEPSYFFKLSKWQEPLLKFYKENPGFIAPESRRNEVIRFVEGGLNDLSISRTTFSWGIPVPGNDKHIMYVWLDALVNYLTAVGYPDESNAELREFWPNVMHMVGKDILRFHAVYWPAFLMSANLLPPQRVFAHGWWTIEGEKMSKSLGNVVAPQDLVSQYGLDQTRYFLMREVPFGNDGNFARETMVNRINSELANTIGNLVQRTLSFIFKNCDGKLPDAKVDTKHYGALLDEVRNHIEAQAFHKALDVIIGLANSANEKIDKAAPWTLKKQGTPESLANMRQVLVELAEDIRVIAILLQPFVPQAAAAILDQLGIAADQRVFNAVEVPLKSGTPIHQPQGVFPRIEAKAA